jgi:hypothetical protein
MRKLEMKNLILLTTLVFCSAGFNSLSYADNHTELAKFVDFKELDKIYGEPKVKINLEKGLLNFMSGFVKQGDPEAGEILSGLEGITVNVYNTGENADAAANSIIDVAKRLQKLNWEPAVSVNEGQEQVRIFVKQKDCLLQGLLFMAAGNDNESVFINIAGNIDPSKIAKVTESLNLDVNIGADNKKDNK